MSDSREKDKIDDIGFSWGIKRGRGGVKKDVQFYESFIYDGEEYFLCDSVFLFKDGEPEPYIGKIIKIWENPNKERKVKILWFFHPSEISTHLGGENVLEKELFLASGEGKGLANVNPLEAIAGKCNVICISKDERNRQPSDEELNLADFVFYRTFDVGNFTISDKLGEKIAAIEVISLLNKKDNQLVGLGSDSKVHNGNVVTAVEKALVPSKNVPGEDEGVQPDTNVGSLSVKDEGAKDLLDMVNNSAHPSDDEKKNYCKKLVVDSEKSCVNDLVPSAIDSDKGQSEVVKVLQRTTSAVRKAMSIDKRGGFEEKPSKRLKLDSAAKQSSENATRERHDSGKSCAKEVVPSTISSDNGQSENDFHRPSSGVRKAMAIDNPGGLEEKPSKKLKLNGENGRKESQKSVVVPEASNKASRPAASVETNIRGKLAKEFASTNNGVPKKLKSNGMIEGKSNDKSLKASLKQPKDVEIEAYGRVKEVMRRPDADKSKWFTALPWEERMKAAQDQGTLVLLQNLDPAYTSSEVEDIVWNGFRESCTAKMVQRTAMSSPHSGQAFVIFKNREAADKIIKKLDRECLMLPNGRPLVGDIGVVSFPAKQSPFHGHLVIDKPRYQMQRDSKAVSTSHSSQSNTVEYEMATEWLLLQSRADLSWKMLYKQQEDQLKKLKANLKSK